MTHGSVPIAILALASAATAQVAETWSLPIDQSPFRDSIGAAVVDASGATTFAGAVQTSAGGNPWPSPTSSGVVARVDAQGALLWHRTHTVQPDWATGFVDLAAGPAGSVYAAGTALPTSFTGPWDLALARYAADGTELWTLRYDTGVLESAAALASDPSGDVWVVGSSAAPGAYSDGLVLRVSASGSIVLARTWNGAASTHDHPYAVAPDGQGGVYVTGYANSDSTYDLVLLRYDGAGNELWSRTIPGGYAWGSDVAVDAAGDVYVAGTVGSTPTPFLGKWDAAGNLLWSRTASDAAHPTGGLACVEIDARGDVVTAGGWGPSSSANDLLVEKHDASGNLLWSLPDAGPGSNDGVATLVLDEAGEIAIAGTTAAAGQLSLPDALALRVDRDGRALWSRTIGTAEDLDFGNGLGFGPAGTVVFAARLGHIQDADLRIVRYDEASVPFCFGDGTGAACPCGNATPAFERAGCASSLGSGARLRADGSASLAADTLTLRGSGMTNASALYFQGTSQVGAGAGSVFGDGLRCAGGTIVRLKTVTHVAGASQFPAAGDPSVSVRGQIAAPGVRTYQVWYRNAAAFCTAGTFNLTNGVQVTWTN